jgi:hypothetical protein
MRVGGEDLVRRTGHARTVAATNVMTRLGAPAYLSRVGS